MTDTDRFRLLGTYATPRVKLGTILTCEARDRDVIVVAYTAARIPWPLGRQRGSSARALVVYGDLAEAVKRESNQAVCHWFGVTPQTVSKWRKALGVGQTNAGTHRLRRDYGEEEWAQETLEMARADPKRAAAIAAAKRKKPRPAAVLDAAHAVNRGRKQSDEERRRRSIARAGRGRADLRPWTDEEDELVRTLPTAEVAAKTGRTLKAVYSRRSLFCNMTHGSE